MLPIVLIIALIWRPCQSLECAVPNVPKTITFDSIARYQGNKIYFSPVKEGWEGSNVAFTCNITKLEKNIFLTFDSESMISMKLSGRQIEEIEPGAFLSLLCLNQLFLDHNRISELSRGVFQNVNRLKVLDVSFNNLGIIHDFTFANLQRLTSLNLSNNQIKHIEAAAFRNLSSLEYLNLRANQLVKLWDDVFRPLYSLTNLTLSQNRLSDIQPEKWGGLARLENLELAANNLEHFDPSYNFSFSSLRRLNLSLNHLTGLNVKQLRTHLPRLEMVDLNDNPWLCTTLPHVIRELEESKIKFVGTNFSAIGIDGIACIDQEGSTSTPAALPPTVQTKTWVDEDEVEVYVKKIIDENNVILRNEIESIKTFVIFVFSFVCVFIALGLLYQSGVCGKVVGLCKRSEPYVEEADAEDVENFRLLHR